MLRKPWFKYLAGALVLLIVLAIATPFVLDAVVRAQLEAHGVAWKKIQRDGFEWRITGLNKGALSAATARLTLSSKPALALRNAKVDLHRLMMSPAAPPEAIPAWLYVSADPALLVYGDHVVASGMRARLSQGRLVASGPTMTVKGRMDGTVDVQLDGDVVIGAGKFDGVARVRMADKVEIRIVEAKFADAASHKVFASDISAELAGAGLDGLSGAIASGKTAGKLDASCGKSAEACMLAIEPPGHPFAMMLADWPRSDLGPAPPNAANAAYEFKLGQLSRAR